MFIAAVLGGFIFSQTIAAQHCYNKNLKSLHQIDALTSFVTKEMTKTNAAAVVDDESLRPTTVEETLFLNPEQRDSPPRIPDGDANVPVDVDRNVVGVGLGPSSSFCWFPNKRRILISITLMIVGCLIAGIVIMSNGNAVESTFAASKANTNTKTKSSKRSQTPAPVPVPSSQPSKQPSVSSQPSTQPSVSSQPSTKPSVSSQPSTQPSVSSQPSTFRRRRLSDLDEEEPHVKVSENLPLDTVREIIEANEHLGATAESTFSYVYELISKKSCENLVKHIDQRLAEVLDSEVELPVGRASQDNMEEKHESWLPFPEGMSNSFDMKLYADEIVEMIGREETLKIIDFFEANFPNKPIDSMYLTRHGKPENDLFLVPWHVDHYNTLEITLNDGYEGGHVLHMNAKGVHKTETEARSGSAIGESAPMSV